jgi:hypothetical protein
MVLEQTAGNGELRAPLELPDLITITEQEASRIPSPGAQRALKAETGKGFDELCGADADGADRTQTLVWMKLRKVYPSLRWADCDEVSVQVEGGYVPDPTKLVASATLPGSVVSGG